MRTPRHLALLAALCAATPTWALAQPTPPTATPLTATLPPAKGQQALALRLEPTGLRARACPAAPCTPEDGTLLPIPPEAARNLPSARGAAIDLADGKHIYRLDIPGNPRNPAEGTFTLLLAAPLAGKGAEPIAFFSGYTGIARGEHGEERESAILDEPAPSGKGRRILIGERRGDVTICGRPALVAAREIDPATLELTRGAAAQSLGKEERGGAQKITAERITGEEKITPVARLLRATAASSAVEKRSDSLTDGDMESTWSENKNGGGEGEFVTIAASSDVPVQGFEITVRPGADIEGGAAPKTIYLATPDRLFEVTMPEDAWKQPPGTRYRVKLPQELHAACVAVVLGDAYAPAAKGANDPKLPRVTLTEIEARTPFDTQSLEGLVGALAGGGERARGAAALLGKTGAPGVQAAIAGYDKLDDAGKELARGVVDGAPCSEQVPFLAARFAESTAPGRPRPAPGDIDPELAHARDRLRRCGRAAAPALAALVEAGPGAKAAPDKGRAPGKGTRTWLLASDELALIAPAEAVPVLLTAIGKASEDARRDLRAALARAAKNPRAWPAIKEELSAERFGALPEVARIDLLRAAGPSLGSLEGAAAAFATLAGPSASFRARYLLQAPASALAGAGDPQALAFLRASLRKDPDAHVRARAAEAAAGVPALAADLLAAVDDSDARVREASVSALARAQAAGAAAPRGLPEALSKRLADDDWTFIRAGAARALGALPASAQVDQALAGALEDLSPEVRGHALDALGAHRAAAHADKVRALADAAEEDLEVRARAILALAAMCDARSVGTWTKLALRAKAPTSDADRRLGSAATAALGAVHPRDLEKRLAPLLQKDTPMPIREMARLAISSPGQCRR